MGAFGWVIVLGGSCINKLPSSKAIIINNSIGYRQRAKSAKSFMNKIIIFLCHYYCIMIQEFKGDKELLELMVKVRQSMQLVQAQLNIIDETLLACDIKTGPKYHECVGAVSVAEVEAIKFMNLNVELVRSLDELKNHVIA